MRRTYLDGNKVGGGVPLVGGQFLSRLQEVQHKMVEEQAMPIVAGAGARGMALEVVREEYLLRGELKWSLRFSDATMGGVMW